MLAFRGLCIYVYQVRSGQHLQDRQSPYTSISMIGTHKATSAKSHTHAVSYQLVGILSRPSSSNVDIKDVKRLRVRYWYNKYQSSRLLVLQAIILLVGC